jgi:hypothetical protein
MTRTGVDANYHGDPMPCRADRCADASNSLPPVIVVLILRSPWPGSRAADRCGYSASTSST